MFGWFLFFDFQILGSKGMPLPDLIADTEQETKNVWDSPLTSNTNLISVRTIVGGPVVNGVLGTVPQY